MAESAAAIFSAGFLLALVVLVQCDQENSRVVNTEQGPVRGYMGDKGYFEFFGIPYATAPTGEHKFRAPLDPPMWTSVYEATKQVACLQASMQENITLFQGTQVEDCLIVNVFVPKTSKKSLPVVVYVHGGAFLMGIGNMVSHEFLIRRDVIVVNFNYRLGAYGFLCLGTKDIPGNAGMKDQVAALRWVQRNIASFGGSPDDVTIAGYSAGSASVEHLMLSPMAKGLFTRVVAESGSALSSWAITPDPIATAKRFMRDISGRSSDDIVEIEDFYKSLTAKQLTQKAYLTESNGSFEFVPCVERKIKGEESFYTQSPLAIIKSGDYSTVPFMPGFATEEGLFRVELFDDWSVRMEDNFADFLPQDLIFDNDEQKKHLAAKVKTFYFGDDPINIHKIKEYVDYFTDVMFSYSIIRSARLHAHNSVPVYLYDYAYVLSQKHPHAHDDKITGANHCAQTTTLNSMLFMGPMNYSKEDRLMQDRLSKMWSNFAKFGVPILETSSLLPVPWKPMEPERVNYLHMDLQFEAKDNLLHERVRFWDAIYRQYYREPVAPGETRIHTEL